MDFRVLGPVEVWSAGREWTHGWVKPRLLLAALLLELNTVVTLDRLTEAVWGEQPPRTVRNGVQGLVSQVRRRLAQAGAPGDGVAVDTGPGGYRLRADPSAVDLHRCRALTRVSATAAAVGDVEAAAGYLREASELWRGVPLDGLTSDWAVRVREHLERERAELLAAWFDLELRLGRHSEVLHELSRSVERHPMAEVLIGQLMLALCRCGREAEALDRYALARRNIVEQLGVEPGSQLQQLHGQILRRNPAPAGPTWTAVSQLPPDIAEFTGRQQQITRVVNRLTGQPPRAAVFAISGKAGVGKTALAIHLAHRLCGAFPDGHLFLNLGGMKGRPVSSNEALARLLLMLGMGRASIPAPLEERAELYRAELAKRRVLIVLDNAANEAQVRPLLPCGTGSAVLITSQNPLAGIETAERLSLRELTQDEALRLLATLAGVDRVHAESAAARSIVNLCGGLPLAIRIAGARLAVRPHWALGELAERLADEAHRLDELQVGDLAVRASFSLTFQGLDERAKRLFRALGMLHAADVPAWVPATLIGEQPDDTAELLERLVDQQLLDAAGRDIGGRQRYRLHDLLAVFARERANAEQAPADEQLGLARLLGGWLTVADQIEGSLCDTAGTSGERHRDTMAYPLGWLAAHHAPQPSPEADPAELAWKLGWAATFTIVAMQFEMRSQWDHWRMTREVALIAAQRVGDRLHGSPGSDLLGVVPGGPTPWGRAAGDLETAQAIFADLGESRWRAAALTSLGNLYRAQGRFTEATAALRHSIHLCQQLDQPGWQAATLFSLASLDVIEGRLSDALGNYRRCLALTRRGDDPLWTAHVHRAIGYGYQQHGAFAAAIDALAQCLPTFRERNDQLLWAHTLLTMGHAQAGMHRFADAVDTFNACVPVFAKLGETRGQAMALRSLATALRDAGDPDAALASLKSSLTLFHTLDDPIGVACALLDLVALDANHAERNQRAASALLADVGLRGWEAW